MDVCGKLAQDTRTTLCIWTSSPLGDDHLTSGTVRDVHRVCETWLPDQRLRGVNVVWIAGRYNERLVVGMPPEDGRHTISMRGDQRDAMASAQLLPCICCNRGMFGEIPAVHATGEQENAKHGDC